MLDADSRAIQQIMFTGKTSEASVIYYFYENNRNNIRIFKRNNKNYIIKIKMVEYNKVNIRLSDTQVK